MEAPRECPGVSPVPASQRPIPSESLLAPLLPVEAASGLFCGPAMGVSGLKRGFYHQVLVHFVGEWMVQTGSTLLRF